MSDDQSKDAQTEDNIPELFDSEDGCLGDQVGQKTTTSSEVKRKRGYKTHRGRCFGARRVV